MIWPRSTVRLLAGSGCDAVNCNADACASPLFPFAELVASRAPADEQEDLLVTALLDTEPVAAEASITLAWRGARDAVAALRTARPEEGGHVLLVTTGGPDTCGGDAALLARLTAAAVEEAGITTFVAAPETTSAREDLDRIALNGGTGEAFLIGPETEGLADLIDALTPVRGTVTCDFALPSAPDSLAFDFERTVMTLTLESDPPIDLRRLSSGEACGNALGWYYDNDSRPTRIVLCVSTCSAVANARHGRIDVGLSCF
jgi:hypothetical protein